MLAAVLGVSVAEIEAVARRPAEGIVILPLVVNAQVKCSKCPYVERCRERIKHFLPVLCETVWESELERWDDRIRDALVGSTLV